MRDYMLWDDILDVFRTFAQSQGFYGRLLRDLQEIEDYDPDRYEAIKEHFESQHFKDGLDVILFVEQ